MELSQIGPWIIEKKIGAGGMGSVYLAHHETTNQVAAVKVLPPSLAREEGFVVRFEREVESIRQLTNTHVVELFESRMDGDTAYYAMEYVDGENLNQRLRREKRLPWREVIAISLELCSALKAAHDAGIIHRDLKPSNLMLTSDGQVKLTDFGVAQVFAANKLTATGGIIGTPEYMSPEQAQGRRATKKSDLYSLGAVMYVMLTGRPPFQGKTSLDIIRKHIYGQFDKPTMIAPDIPHWLEDIVCKLLEKDPDKRYPDAYVLSLNLRSVEKKVRLSTEDYTLTDDGVPAEDSTMPAPTRLVTGVAARSSDRVEAGPGEGTLMRDFMRADAELQQQSTPLGELLNNGWVLVLCLLLLVAGGFWWFRPVSMPPAAKFDAGVAMMEQSEGPDWLTARDEYFLPLMEEDAEQWGERVEPYLTQIEAYELKTRVGGNRALRKQRILEDEADRFLMLAQQSRNMGDTARAKRTLTALIVLLDGNPGRDKQHRLALELLKEIEAERIAQAGAGSLMTTSLERARTLLEQGERESAQKILESLTQLYADDPDVRGELEQAHTLLEELSTET